MAQLRIYEPKDHPHSALICGLGFRWCNKDQRYEKRGKASPLLKRALQESGLAIKVLQSEGEIETEIMLGKEEEI